MILKLRKLLSESEKQTSEAMRTMVTTGSCFVYKSLETAVSFALFV